jgi:predicted nucleic-acid-binding protein
MRAVDTNVIVRLLAKDDPAQVAIAKTFVEAGAWVSIIALTEAIWVLASTYGRNATQLAAFVEMLIEHDKLVLQDSDAVEAALNLFRSRPSLGFSDCLVLELARKAGHLPLGTFDRSLGSMDGVKKL